MDAAIRVCQTLDKTKIDRLAKYLQDIRNCNGRLFILGVGGSAANASHAVNDFRKLCGIEAYAPTDNVAELTARTNDEGWKTTFVEWLKVSNLGLQDTLLVLSVGGGTVESSPNLIEAIKYAKETGSRVYSIVGKNTGYAAVHSDICIIIPCDDEKLVTPVSEAFQIVILHCLVSHPLLQKNPTKW